MSLYPFPFSFLSGGPRAFVVLDAGAVLDAVTVAKTSRNVEKLIEDLVVGAETISLLRALALAALQEDGVVLDGVTVAKTNRNVDKVISDLLVGTELPALFRDIVLAAVQEAGAVLDGATVEKIARNVEKLISDTFTGAETITQLRSAVTFAVQEAGAVLDAATVEKISRTITKTISQLVSGAETITLDIVVLLPVVDGVTANDAFFSRANCLIDPGARCESVRVEYNINGGAWNFLENIDTTPNGSNVTSSDVQASSGDTVTFRVYPYSGDNATGTAGDPVSDSIQVS